MRDEEYDRQFWTNIDLDAFALKLMMAGAVEPDPGAMANQQRRYRLTFICPDCPAAHRVHGTYGQVSAGMQVLLTRGIRSVHVEEMEYATEADAARVEKLLDSEEAVLAADHLAAVLGRKPKEG